MSKHRWTSAMMADAMEAVLNGATWSEAGAAFGVTKERMRQVVHKAARMMCHPATLDEPRPDHDHYKVDELRANKAFWLRQTARFRDPGGIAALPTRLRYALLADGLNTRDLIESARDRGEKVPGIDAKGWEEVDRWLTR